MDKALLVGINKYPIAPLRGCVNDIADMSRLLAEKCGFAMSDIRLLADQRATTKAILERLNWLVDGAKPGDRLFFHYSGHGVQMATRDHQGEIDGLDEVVCPVDFDWTDAHVIRDKDFRRVFGSVPQGVQFVWVSDSCHSGDLTRDFPPEGVLWRSCPVPPDIQWRNDSAIADGARAFSMTRASAELPGVALLSGCQADQTSADAIFAGRPNGALTYFLLKVLGAVGGLKLPLVEVLKAVKTELVNSGRFHQVPGLEGSLEIAKRPFLGAA
jgi:metacaspase-1